MTESITPSLAQQLQVHRGLTEKILDKATSDPTWKEQLLDDPQAAMRAADFPEFQQLRQIEQRARAPRQDEVRGQVATGGHGGDETNLTVGTTGGCVLYCYYWSFFFYWKCS